MTKTSWPVSLTKADREMFTRFRIPSELVKAAHIERVTNLQGWNQWRLPAPRNGSYAGLIFPYMDQTDTQIVSCSVRRDQPDVKKNGKPDRKYLLPAGGNRLYFPPGTTEKLRNPDTALVLVEAEKSALAITAWSERGPDDRFRWLPLAMGGCWRWSQDKAPLPDLDVCRGRTVCVMLDANAATNAKVQKARAALVTALKRMGADALIAHMPQIENVNGPDDLLALPEGDQLLAAVLDAAATAVAAPHSEDALAARFAEEQKDDLRFVKQWGKWLVWDGQRWQQDVTDQALSRAATLLELVAGEECVTDSEAKRVRSAKTIREVVKLAGIHDRLAATADLWDADSWVLNTPDGVVDLRTGILRPAKREDFCTKMTAVAPAKVGPKQKLRWHTFLEEVTQGDRELQTYMQKICGYCLTGSTREEAIFFLYGTGKNGKSKFVGAISELLGDYSRAASMDSFVVAYHGPQHPTDLAGLQGARLVTASETTEGRKWDEAKIKSISGGDRITARFMRQDFFDYVPQFKLLLHGNHKPGLRDTDEAIKRRLHLIPFNANIPDGKRDPELADKLRKEWPYILQWMVAGCVLWQKQGLRTPQSVAAMTAEYFESQDLLGRWLAEVTDKKAPLSKIEPRRLYQNFSRWADASGEKYTYEEKSFSQRMAERGYRSEKGHAGKRTLSGRWTIGEAGGGGCPVKPPSNKRKKNLPRAIDGAPASTRRPKFAGTKPMVN